MTKKFRRSPAKKRKTPRKHDIVLAKLDKVLSVEKKLLDEEKKIGATEKKLEEKEEEIRREDKETLEEEKKEDQRLEDIDKEIKIKEKKTEEGLTEIEKLELEIKEEVGEHPLTKVGFKDIIKGLVGAFIGLAVHYSFVYGVKVSEHIDMTRATFLFVLAFFVGLLFIYATGFRKVKDPKILMFMPVRLLVLYAAAVIMSVVVLLIFYPEFGHTLEESYKMISGVLLAAIIGACTADLIGKD